MNNYTKGKWRVGREPISDLSTVITDEHTIAIGLSEANAHLISASPDLYEACKKLAEWDTSNDDAGLISEACSFARMALAKAEA